MVEEALVRAFLGGHGLRHEDQQKALQLVPLLAEVERMARTRVREPFVMVDACAGKSALGILAAALLLGSLRRGPWRVVALEHDPARAHAALAGAQKLEVADHVHVVTTDVADASQWPDAPDLVVALHACGRASDDVIERATAANARTVLLVPCCYAAGPRHDGRATEVRGQGVADAWAAATPLPRHGLVGRRFAQAIIDAERTLRLEAAGYETEVVEVFSPTSSPYNTLWRARRVREPVRTAQAAAVLSRLLRPMRREG
jgi:predicted RNA methylase